MSLVETDWLEKNISSVKIIDCSWHMPQTKRSGLEEYKNQHIPNSIFFDLDANSKKEINLPHMLVHQNDWVQIVSKMGIKNEDEIVIYDNSDVISSCRCWYNFIYFGHNPNLIKVLDGGLKKWVSEKKPTTNNIINIEPSHYSANEKIELVKNKAQIDENILTKEFLVIDARSKERFEGVVPEPRKGLRSGSINNSYCLPFSELINSDHTFIDKEKIFQKFSSIKSSLDKNIVFTCGSGVTAAVLALAYSLIDNKYMPTIYDSSWSEYGRY